WDDDRFEHVNRGPCDGFRAPTRHEFVWMV
ncbi:MAG: hypothetical protein ACI9OJ_001883, partial [Myxococcota bacterium]